MRPGDGTPSARDDPDALVAEIDAARESLRDTARRTLGIAGEEHVPSLRTLRQDGQLPVYPLVALGLLSAADMFQSYALTVLTPEISRTLGVSIGAIALGRSLQFLAMALAPLPVAALTQHRPRRAILCIATGIAWSVTTLCTGFVISLIGLLVILALNGLASGSVSALHAPLVMDSYHPSARVRAMSVYTAFGSLGNVVSPLLVALLAGALGFTWRGVFLALGLTSLTMALIAIRLRDPGFGKWDTDRLREAVRMREGGGGDRLDPADTRLGFWEICRRMLMVPTNRRLYGGFVVLGIVSIPFWTYLSGFLELRWNLGPGERGLFLALFFAAGVLGLLTYGRRGEKQFRENPARLLQTVGVLLACAVSLVAVGALMPAFGGVLVCFGLAGALLAILQPGLAIGMLSIVPSQMRPHAPALAGIFTAVGGLLGVLFLTGIDRGYGVSGALVGDHRARRRRRGGTGECGEVRRSRPRPDDRRGPGGRGDPRDPRRAAAICRCWRVAGIDFSYGQLQVLFDVDFTVDDGEMVALLGTNGAGKSTLLKVIAGSGCPTGSVRFRGTRHHLPRRRAPAAARHHADPRRQRGVRPDDRRREPAPLRLHHRRGPQRALEPSHRQRFEAFPRLAERRKHAGRRPVRRRAADARPVQGADPAAAVAAHRRAVARAWRRSSSASCSRWCARINAEGTAVVLVEQSVNIALDLVEHAYFMEKGEMRFDGRSRRPARARRPAARGVPRGRRAAERSRS